jgi:hypothetical protein
MLLRLLREARVIIYLGLGTVHRAQPMDCAEGQKERGAGPDMKPYERFLLVVSLVALAGAVAVVLVVVLG